MASNIALCANCNDPFCQHCCDDPTVEMCDGCFYGDVDDSLCDFDDTNKGDETDEDA